jgi:hypothetical protein
MTVGSRLFPQPPVYVEELAAWRPKRWTASACFVAAAVALATLAVARWNPWALAVLHDHDGPRGYVAVAGPFVVAGVVALLPSWRRWSGAGWAAGAVAVVLLCAAALTAFARTGSPSVIAHATTAGGSLTVRVREYHDTIDPAWDAVIERRANGRVREASAGCIYGEIATYEKLFGITPGLIRLQITGVAAPEVIEIRFDPVTLRVTEPIPPSLCG